MGWAWIFVPGAPQGREGGGPGVWLRHGHNQSWGYGEGGAQPCHRGSLLPTVPELSYGTTGTGRVTGHREEEGPSR